MYHSGSREKKIDPPPRDKKQKIRLFVNYSSRRSRAAGRAVGRRLMDADGGYLANFRPPLSMGARPDGRETGPESRSNTRWDQKKRGKSTS